MRFFGIITILYLTLSFSGFSQRTDKTITNESRVCHANHSDEWTISTEEDGVNFYFKINHCKMGDVVLLKVENTNGVDATVRWMEYVESANQAWRAQSVKEIVVPANSFLSAESCDKKVIKELRVDGFKLFPGETYPQFNAFPELLKFELFNTLVQK